ncbi:MAG: hypothetical protein RLZZ480_580 [Candidatus Parcubacteria bacterium]|jgi:hypothetical protein
MGIVLLFEFLFYIVIIGLSLINTIKNNWNLIFDLRTKLLLIIFGAGIGPFLWLVQLVLWSKDGKVYAFTPFTVIGTYLTIVSVLASAFSELKSPISRKLSIIFCSASITGIILAPLLLSFLSEFTSYFGIKIFY